MFILYYWIAVTTDTDPDYVPEVEQAEDSDVDECENDGDIMIRNFVESMKNGNTRRMTDCHVKAFKKFLTEKGERRELEEMPAVELDKILARFYFQAKKSNNEDYEPTTLLAIACSINRYE